MNKELELEAEKQFPLVNVENASDGDPNIDIPKVVDEVRRFAEEFSRIYSQYYYQQQDFENGIIQGYNKSQETHPFSEEDMIEFLDWKEKNHYVFTSDGFTKIGVSKFYATEELLQIWKEQRIKTVYYE